MDGLEPFRGERNRQFTGDEVFFHDHLCRASLPREHIDAAVTSMKSAEGWSGLAEWIRALAAVATLFAGEIKNKHSRRLRSTMAGKQAALLGTGTCGNEALHAELRSVFRQAYNVPLPTFWLKLDLFKLSKPVSFDCARRIPLLRQMNESPVVLGEV